LFRQDYILRLIEEAAAALARAFAALAGKKYDLALVELARAFSAASKLDRRSFDALDTRTVARLLGSPEQIRMVARILAAEADVHEQLGNALAARRCLHRARDLLLELSELTAEDQQTLADLGTRLRAHEPSRQS
jgi:hypothetical protein